MRVALITDGIWPFSMGGMQKHSFYLCKHFALHKIPLDVYYCTESEFNVAELNGFLQIDHPEAYINLIFVPSSRVRTFPGHYLIETFLNSRSVHNEVNKRKLDYDIIYVQGLLGWSLLAEPKSGGKRKPPVIVNLHGLNMFQRVVDVRSRLEQLVFRPVALKQLKRADYVQSLGGKLSEILLKHGVKTESLVKLGIGIESSWIAAPVIANNNIRRFVFIGRNDRVKGIRELNKALHILVQKADFEFHFIGPIPEALQISEKNLIYHGAITNEERIKAILDLSDFLVVPSYSEGMPTVILEAMARNCIIIATNVGAVAELVSEKNGFLIKPQSVESLVAAIEESLAIPSEELVKMKGVSNQLVQEFVWEKLILKMKRFFESIITKR